VTAYAGDPAAVLDLANTFDDPAVAGTPVRFNTVLGSFNVELYDTAAPQTVANFLNYVRGGDYWSHLVHRVVPGFVVQGGGYWYPEWSAIPADPPVANEPGLSNVRGTLAMAKLPGDPNSATSQWFVNLADNSDPLDTDNGGYTVFGHVLGNGMAVVDAIAAVPTYDVTMNSINFPEIPLRDFSGPPAEPGNANVVLVNDVYLVPKVAIEATSDNPALVTVNTAGQTLRLSYVAGQLGTATITVTGHDLTGGTVQDSFTVTVRSRPLAQADAAATHQGEATLIPVLANDQPQGPPIDPATVAVATQPLHGNAVPDPATGVVTYTPLPDYYGSDTFTYQVSDTGGGVSLPATVTVAINARPIVTTPLPDVTLEMGAPNTTVSLFDYFGDPDWSYQGTVVNFDTVLGQFRVELYNAAAPLTVANFLNYVAGGDYASTVIHRVVPDFVVQAGGYAYPGWQHIPTDPPVVNEFSISNTRGTLAMAKMSGDPNSATSEWFFNLVDNSASLDGSNGGYTVFGRVLDNGMSVVDAIAAVPTFAFASPFAELPLINYTTFPSEPAPENIVLLNNITAVYPLTFQITNDNPALVTPTVSGGQLTLAYAAGQAGTATITVRATDPLGAFVEETFQITVTGPPLANADTQAVPQGVQSVIDVLANDIPRGRPLDPATVTLVTQPQNGAATVDPLTGAVAYTPAPGFAGPDPFTYTVQDTEGRTSQPATIQPIVEWPAVVLGTGLPGTLRYRDPDGTDVTATFGGGGNASFSFSGYPTITSNNGTTIVVGGTQLGIYRVDLAGTTTKSALTFATAGGTVAGSAFGGLGGTLPMGRVAAPTMDLGNDIRMAGQGYIASLQLARVLQGADIVMPGAGALKGLAISIGQIPDPGTDITAGSGIASLTIGQWAGSTLTAPWVSRLTVAGALGASIHLTGVGALKGALASASVGQVTGGTWDIDGSVGTITVGTSAAGWTLDVQNRLATLAATTSLGGTVRAGSIGAIRSAQDIAAAISTTGSDPKAGASVASLSAPRADGTTVIVPGGVGAVSVSKWLGGGIRAAWLNSLATRANTTLGLPGDFEAGLVLLGAQGRVSLPRATIVGSLKNALWDITGGIGSLAVANSVANWAGEVTGAVGRLTFDRVASSALDVTGAIASLAATDWLGGSIGAASLGSLVITGDTTAGVEGDFTPNLTLTGQGVAAGSPTLNSVAIARFLALSTWNVTGLINSITAAFVEDWTLTAHGSVTTLDLGHVLSATLTVDSAIDSITVQDWLDGSIRATVLNSLDVTGLLTAGILADFQADLTLTGAQGVANTLGTVDVARRLQFATWDITGNVGTISVYSWFRNMHLHATGNIASLTVGAMDGSTVYAGVANGVTGLPDAAADFAGPATIGKLVVVGIPTTITPQSFYNSVIAAPTLNSVSLINVQTDNSANNGALFGVAGQTIRTLTWKQGNASYSWPNRWPGLTGHFVVRVIPT